MSIENLLRYIEAITLLFPLVEKVVDLVERIFEKFGVKKGEEKKELAMKALKTYVGATGVELPDEVLSTTIDFMVDGKNRSGEYSHTSHSGEFEKH